MNIIHLQRHQINAEKWAACVERAQNGLIYSTLPYLDAMSPGWSGLVLDDYSAVMPLTARKKWGFAYLHQPYLTAQTGVSGNGLTGEVILSFIRSIPPNFRYLDISLNYGNSFDLSRYNVVSRRNYVLPLASAYADLQSNYRQVIKRNVKKAMARGCRVEQNTPLNEILQLAKNFTPGTMRHIADLQNFSALFAQLKSSEKAITYGVYAKEGSLLASAVFLFSHQRAYYILVGNHPQGRRTGASHLLIDAFVRDHAGQPLLLDFEGSDIPGLAFFYNSFGARAENYPALKWNRLPWFARWLKK